MESTQPIFAFEDPIDYLNYEFRERQKRNARFSLRAWARQVGYENPSLLSDVLKKERRLKLELAEKLAANLSLKGKPKRYFELMVLLQSSQTELEKKMYGKMLRSIRPAKARTLNEFSLDLFSLTADSYHWAILELTQLKDFFSDESYIFERLKGSVDRKAIRDAVERLVRLGLLTRNENGALARASSEPTFMRNKLPAESVRTYHEQVIEKAKASVREQSPEERYLRGTTLALKEEDYDRACEIIRSAHKQILALAAQGDGDDLFQFNSQLFRLTKKREVMKQ
jgi:uncharacterized protein (TIGR02147 family)